MSWFTRQAKVTAAEKTERDIDATRLEYVPVAVRSQILFFCVSDLSNVDPMYQYSLEWFLAIFMAAIANSERAGRKQYNSKFQHALWFQDSTNNSACTHNKYHEIVNRKHN